MTELLLQQVTRIAPDIPLAQTTLLVAAHGTGLNENSAVAAKNAGQENRILFGGWRIKVVIHKLTPFKIVKYQTTRR